MARKGMGRASMFLTLFQSARICAGVFSASDCESMKRMVVPVLSGWSHWLGQGWGSAEGVSNVT